MDNANTKIVLKTLVESLNISKETIVLIEGLYSRPLMSRHIMVSIMHVKVCTHG
jgi:uncharacterized protein YggU (UPF0235/DUF167 family)